MKHFQYPATEHPWRFDLPWQCLGSWFFYHWTHHGNNRFTVGFRVLGFTKIYWVWTIEEEKAKTQYTINQKKAFETLEKFLTSTEN